MQTVCPQNISLSNAEEHDARMEKIAILQELQCELINVGSVYPELDKAPENVIQRVLGINEQRQELLKQCRAEQYTKCTEISGIGSKTLQWPAPLRVAARQ